MTARYIKDRSIAYLNTVSKPTAKIRIYLLETSCKLSALSASFCSSFAVVMKSFVEGLNLVGGFFVTVSSSA